MCLLCLWLGITTNFKNFWMIKFLSKWSRIKPTYPVLGIVVLCLAVLPGFSHASLLLRVAESSDESVQIDLSADGNEPICTGRNGQIFYSALGIRKLSEKTYVQELNSEASDNEEYLKAARMGGGIYIYLPYFFPVRDCKNVVFEITARHILWGDKWHSGSIRINAEAARGKAIFFTNELAPVVQGSSYFDASIPAPTLARLQAAFTKITRFYQGVLKTNPLSNVGVVTAVVHNKGNYSGYGGDSVNIIRMSYDNPNPAQLLTLDELMPSTLAHELAHKLQSDSLYKRPMARFIAEGGAEFLKVIILRNSGLASEDEAKNWIRKAASECAKFSDARTLYEKAGQKTYNFREPYDCGMVYYFVSYYSSGLSAWEFIDALRQAMLSENNYGGREKDLCLLFETTCSNENLIGASGEKNHYLQQMLWLGTALENRSLPLLAPRE